MTDIRLQGRQVAVEFAQLQGLRGEGSVFAHSFHQVVELGFVRGAVGLDALPDAGQAFNGGLLLAGGQVVRLPEGVGRGRLVRSWLLRDKKGL
jgi:hypothetical protein